MHELENFAISIYDKWRSNEIKRRQKYYEKYKK